MSAFNLVTAETKCPKCGVVVRMEIQFKFGDLRQYEYRLGDKIILTEREERWAPNKLVLAEGIGGPCPNCGADFIDFDVYINRGIVEQVAPRGADISYGHSTFIIKD